MEIPLGVYENITGSDELPPPVDKTDFERRKHRRVPLGSRAIIYPIVEGIESLPSVVMVQDISIGGLKIQSCEPLPKGTRFIIQFKRDQRPSVRIRGMAVHCETGGVGETQFIIGATFEEVLKTETPSKPIVMNQPVEIPKPVEMHPPVEMHAPVEILKPVEVPKPVEIPPVVKIPKPVETHKPAPTQVHAVARAASPPPKQEPTISEPAAHPSGSEGNTQAILARVKELLAKQTQTIEAQKQLLNQERQKVEKLNGEIEALNHQMLEFHLATDADAKAVADLAKFLEEQILPRSESPLSDSQGNPR